MIFFYKFLSIFSVMATFVHLYKKIILRYIRSCDFFGVKKTSYLWKNVSIFILTLENEPVILTVITFLKGYSPIFSTDLSNISEKMNHVHLTIFKHDCLCLLGNITTRLTDLTLLFALILFSFNTDIPGNEHP